MNKTTFPKCVRCGEPNMTEQFFGECVVCYDCAEECGGWRE